VEPSDGVRRREFEKLLVDKKVFFFAGSGICRPSGVPMADDILKASAQVFLSDHPLLSGLLSRIQPERFYERLLELTEGDKRRLALWRILSLPFRPNINHFFLVLYSRMMHTPLFTTNFDLLFEEAARVLGIECNVIEGTTNLDPERLNFEKLNLMKLHGSMGKEGDVAGLYVTMTEISRFNPSIVEYLKAEMERRFLTIVGYSGRDLDYFPFIRGKSKDPKANDTYWINAFRRRDSIDYRNAISMGSDGARIIFSYPDEYLSSLEFARENGLTEITTRANPDSDATLDAMKESTMWRLRREAREDLVWTMHHKLLFLGSLLEATGNFRASQKILNRVRASPLARLSAPQRYILMWCFCSDAHNLSEFAVLKDYAKELSKIRISDTSLRPLLRIVGMIVGAEQHRMLVPYMSFIYSDFAAKLYRGQLANSHEYNAEITAEISQIISEFSLGDGLEITVDRGAPQEVFQILAQQEVLEHLVRSLAIDQQLVKDFACMPQDSITEELLRPIDAAWKDLRDRCYRLGYYAGVANCNRHRYRSVSSESELPLDLEQAKNIAIVANLETTRHLANQQLVDFYMRCSKVDLTKINEQMLIDLFGEALLMENYLNALKSFLALLEYDRLTDPDWAYKTDFRRRARQLNESSDNGVTRTLRVVRKYNPLWRQYLEWLDRDLPIRLA